MSFLGFLHQNVLHILHLYFVTYTSSTKLYFAITKSKSSTSSIAALLSFVIHKVNREHVLDATGVSLITATVRFPLTII